MKQAIKAIWLDELNLKTVNDDDDFLTWEGTL